MNKLFPIVLALLFFSCTEEVVAPAPEHGCLDSQACNYNPNASIDNNSCFYAEDWEDECGVCDTDTTNNNSTCSDDCGVVNGDNSSCTDCNGVVNGSSSLDECGVCDGDSSTCLDECGVVNGDGYDCGGSCGENIELWGECYNIEETTYINLESSGLTGEIPPEIGELINLTNLYLNNNQLTGAVPAEIGDLNSLAQLYLNNNLLTTLPESICDISYQANTFVEDNLLCNKYHFECLTEDEWDNYGNNPQDQSNCCEGLLGQPNWTECAE